jgi:methyl-accepting chemotaxis protein
VAGGLFAVVIAFLVARSIARPILYVAQDLSASSRQTAAAAAQLGSAGNSLVDTASEEASASEECAASVGEMREQARKSNELTDGASEMMKENLRRSGDSLRAIVDINQRMNEMQADSGEMRKIMKSIDEIAFQTNILALNAAVEAARAGEAGTGFAVVAEEVRALAMRSAEAAKSTQKLLDNMAHRIGDGVVATKGINDNFEAIVETATAMGDRIERLTATSHEILSGLEQVTKATEQGAQASQRVAAISEETGAASEELNAQARAMAEIVSRLNAIIHGQAAHLHNQDSDSDYDSGSAPTPSATKALERSTDRLTGNGHGLPKAASRQAAMEKASTF